MDTWEVKGTLRLVVVFSPCAECEGECHGHPRGVEVAETVEADDAEGAFYRAREVVVENELIEEHALFVETAIYVGPEPTAINVSALARERAALTAWNTGLPIPGGPPIEWGPRNA